MTLRVFARLWTLAGFFWVCAVPLGEADLGHLGAQNLLIPALPNFPPPHSTVLTPRLYFLTRAPNGTQTPQGQGHLFSLFTDLTPRAQKLYLTWNVLGKFLLIRVFFFWVRCCAAQAILKFTAILPVSLLVSTGVTGVCHRSAGGRVQGSVHTLYQLNYIPSSMVSSLLLKTHLLGERIVTHLVFTALHHEH